MINLDYKGDLDCCEAILSLIVTTGIHGTIQKSRDPYCNMIEVLKRYNYPLIKRIAESDLLDVLLYRLSDFTLYLNNKYNLNYTLTNYNYLDYYVKNVPDMYKLAIREIKLDQIIND